MQQAGEGGRDAHFGQAGSFNAPGWLLGDDDTLGHQHFDQLFHVVGVALGVADHQVTQGIGQWVNLVQELQHQLAAFIARKRGQGQAAVGGFFLPPGWAALEQGGAGQGNDQQGLVSGQMTQALHHLQR